MVKELYLSLAKARIERSSELFEESKLLYSNNLLKSANNRAYYAIEKALNALLATKGVETRTHNGCLKQFNLLFIHEETGFFFRNRL